MQGSTPEVETFLKDTMLPSSKNTTTMQVPRNILFFFFLRLFAFSRAAPAAYGGSQARGLIGAVDTGLCQRHSNAGIRAASTTYTTAHGNAGSPTH